MPAEGTKTRLLLYGAYGYTGRLTAELAAARKLDIVLAGRNRGALSELGDRLGLPTRVIRVDHPKRLSDALKDIACVVHMASPFAVTSGPMLDACLATQTNYIDVTGESMSSRPCGHASRRSVEPELRSCRELVSMLYLRTAWQAT